MRIYIAGALTDDVQEKMLENVNRAIEVGVELLKLGHVVFIPHLSYFIELNTNCDLSYEDYMRNDLAWLEICDAIFLLRHSEHSRGTQRELNFAIKRNIQVIVALEDRRLYGE